MRKAEIAFDVVGAGLQVLVADFVFAQNLAGIVFDLSHSFSDHVVDFDLQEQVGTALQVKAEIDRPPPFGQFGFVADNVRYGKEYSRQTDGKNNVNSGFG